MRTKPIIAVDLSTSGKGGGPYVSTRRVVSSRLKDKYDFRIIHYRTELGKGISIRRINDLKKQLKVLSPDIVHFTGLQLSGFHLAIACSLVGIKRTVLTIHGTSSDALYFNFFKKIVLKYCLEPLTLYYTYKYYCVSDYVGSKKIAKLFTNKSLGTIYNIPPRISSVQTSTVRADLGIDSGDIVVVSVARITREKGYQFLDEAILLLKGRRDVKFIIVGDGEYLPAFKKKLKDQIYAGQVFCLGYREDIQNILRGCDIFVLPTLHETLSIALLEASKEGLALVASNTGGIPEIIENEYNGILVEPSDSVVLKKAIERLIDDRTLVKMYGNNAKARLHKIFSEENIVNRIDEVYQTLLSS